MWGFCYTRKDLFLKAAVVSFVVKHSFDDVWAFSLERGSFFQKLWDQSLPVFFCWCSTCMMQETNLFFQQVKPKSSGFVQGRKSPLCPCSLIIKESWLNRISLGLVIQQNNYRSAAKANTLYNGNYTICCNKSISGSMVYLVINLSRHFVGCLARWKKRSCSSGGSEHISMERRSSTPIW